VFRLVVPNFVVYTFNLTSDIARVIELTRQDRSVRTPRSKATTMDPDNYDLLNSIASGALPQLWRENPTEVGSGYDHSSNNRDRDDTRFEARSKAGSGKPNSKRPDLDEWEL
jgi:hypothetical protein